MPSPLAAAFASLLRRAPHAPVAWTIAGQRDRRDLDAAAGLVVARLAEIPTGCRVAVSVRDDFGLLAVVLALWRRGDAAVLLDAADPQAPRVDLARRLLAAAVVIDGAGTFDPARLAVVAAAAPAPAEELAAIKVTSGSTGEPCGIGVSAAELLADSAALERTMGIGDGDRLFGAVPMSFSYGVGSLLVPALAHGRCLVLPGRDPGGLLQALRTGEPTVLPAVPALLRGLLAGGFAPPPSLRLLLSAGAPLAPDVAARCRAAFGLPVHAFYGATECGGITFDRTGKAAERGTVGTPVDGVDVACDADGRVVVRSPAVGRALDGSGNPAAGRFATADLGRFCSGELELLGRSNDVFDVGGHKIAPREIERVIGGLPGVEEVVVVPWRDACGRAACAALVAASGTDGPAVRRHCAAYLPPAKVPRCIVVLPSLPRTARGKLVRHDIERLLHAAGALEAS